MIDEIDTILKRGCDQEEVEPFDDGSYQVSMEILQMIYTAGFKEGSQSHGNQHVKSGGTE